MNAKLITVFIAALIIIGGGAYAAGLSQGRGDKKAVESNAMEKQKSEDEAMMKKDKEADAMKKKEEDAAMKKAEGDAMKKTETTTPTQ